MSKKIHDTICERSRFDTFFKTHYKDLGNFLYYKFGDRLNPQDKMQEAFVKLWENCKKVTPDKAKSYVYKVATNLMLNEVAHQKVVLKYQETKPRDYTNESPEFLMEENEYLQKLEKAIASLTEAERVAFLMNRIDGKRLDEIAVILDISRKAVEKRVYGALKKLRREIEGI